MKNQQEWSPTKFIKNKRGEWVPSNDTKMVGVGSRFIAGIQIKVYEKLLRKYSKGHLLDLGCGSVPLYGIYKEYVNRIDCVDWENSLHQNKYLDITADLNNKLPLKSNQYDTSILTDVLEHISEPQSLLSELYRVLKPNGICIITVPFMFWIHEIPHDYHRYTKFALKYMSEKAGFNILELEPYGGSPEVFIDFISKHLAVFKPLSIFFQSISKVFVNTKIVKKFSIRSSKLYPLGYFLVIKKGK